MIVGAGVFGAAAARTLAARGAAVTVVEPGPVPHVDAASTDISKAIRMDYGADAFYAAQMEAALDGWAAWNAAWGERLFHDDGVTFLARTPLATGGFEFESARVIEARGHRIERLDAAALAERFPAWAATRYPDGYFNPRGGWAASGAVVARLWSEALARGVTHRAGRCVGLVEEAGRVTGARLADGSSVHGDAVVVAAGAWTAALLPQLAEVMWATAQPVLHFRPADPTPFRSPRFVTWGADIARTGWYGFPANDEGIVKVAHHGSGERVDPSAPREPPWAEEGRFRAFLRDALPGLADAPLVGARRCLYSDTFDGDFWIDRDPDRPGLVVAAGGSGHAFKFAPLLGNWAADAVDGRPVERFRWRGRGPDATEAARFDG